MVGAWGIFGFRGRIAIHAGAKKATREDLLHVAKKVEIPRGEVEAWASKLRYGMIVGSVRVAAVTPNLDDLHEADRGWAIPGFDMRYWVLRNHQFLALWPPMRGRQGLWKISPVPYQLGRSG